VPQKKSTFDDALFALVGNPFDAIAEGSVRSTIFCALRFPSPGLRITPICAKHNARLLLLGQRFAHAALELLFLTHLPFCGLRCKKLLQLNYVNLAFAGLHTRAAFEYRITNSFVVEENEMARRNAASSRENRKRTQNFTGAADSGQWLLST
jgi:hypothetical protein